MRSAAARGEFADLERARKGSRALRARVCSMVRVYLELTMCGGES